MINRYDVQYDRKMTEDKLGKYVLYTDYSKLEAELEEVKLQEQADCKSLHGWKEDYAKLEDEHEEVMEILKLWQEEYKLWDDYKIERELGNLMTATSQLIKNHEEEK